MSKSLNNPFQKLSRSPIKKLIGHFNSIPVDDDIQRLFYLQKISQVLNKNFNTEVFQFVNENPSVSGSWESILLSYNINPDASFFLKGIHFANAISSKAEEVEEIAEEDIYSLMQERDHLLEDDKNFAANRKRFIDLCARISFLAKTQDQIIGLVTKYEQILALTKLKMSAIKGHTSETSTGYKTEPLGEHQVNNYNCKLLVKGWPEPLVLRIEDRAELSIEEKLHSHKVSQYFGGEVGTCWVQILNEETNDIKYSPLALGQYANQGNLRHVAKKLRNANSAKIASAAKHYFAKLNDFCLELKKAGVYHPDIKLSNFLIHNETLLVSDRKTFIDNPNPTADKMRSTPPYAPPQYADCLNEDCDAYLDIAKTTHFNMEQFMAYQVGMALKEFLILTQMDDLPDEYWAPDCNIAAYFKNPTHQITNLSLITGEMTRLEEGKRLSIKQFQELRLFLAQKPDVFAKKLEDMLPSADLGPEIDGELAEIKKLLADATLTGTELLGRANPIFKAILERKTQEPRLTWYAGKLAAKTLQEGSGNYFSQLAKQIEDALLEHDWAQAPWYRKIAHVLTFGYFRVAHLTKVSKIKIDLDFQDPAFQIHVPQLAFLPPSALDGFSPNLEKFLKKHFREIKPQDSSTPGSASSSTNPKDTIDSNPLTPEATPPSDREDDINSDSMPSGTVVFKENVNPGEKSPLDDIVFEDTVKANPNDDETKSSSEEENEEDGGYDSIIIKDDADTPKKTTGTTDTPRADSIYTFFTSAKKDIPHSDETKIEVKKIPKSYRRSLHRADSLLRKGETPGIFVTPKLPATHDKLIPPNPETICQQ